jgi:hypothetical protein
LRTLRITGIIIEATTTTRIIRIIRRSRRGAARHKPAERGGCFVQPDFIRNQLIWLC